MNTNEKFKLKIIVFELLKNYKAEDILSAIYDEYHQSDTLPENKETEELSEPVRQTSKLGNHQYEKIMKFSY